MTRPSPAAEWKRARQRKLRDRLLRLAIYLAAVIFLIVILALLHAIFTDRSGHPWLRF